MTPRQLRAVNRILRREYERLHAPVHDFAAARTEDPFRVLVSTVLSARTRDATTAGAVKRLFQRISSPADLAALPEEEVRRLIFPVGFHRVKARHLKALPRALAEESGGAIPRDIEGLCRLPGVGRKTANLVLSVAFDQPAICVDVHVHRICNRWGLVRTLTPEQTETALRGILPVAWWKTWNERLVSFGQRVCTPRRPACSRCALKRYCRRLNVTAGR